MVVNLATGTNLLLQSSPLIRRFPMKHRRDLCRVVLFSFLSTSFSTLSTQFVFSTRRLVGRSVKPQVLFLRMVSISSSMAICHVADFCP